MLVSELGKNCVSDGCGVSSEMDLEVSLQASYVWWVFFYLCFRKSKVSLSCRVLDPDSTRL